MTVYEQVVAEAAAARAAHGGNPRWWEASDPLAPARRQLAYHRDILKRRACKCEKCHLARLALSPRTP
jgi:hypothetical protein